MKHFAIVMALLILMLGPGEAKAQGTCAGIKPMVTSAITHNQLAQLRTLYELAVTSTDCPPAFSKRLGHKISLLYFRKENAPSRDELLWRTLALLGDVYNDEKDFTLASAFYYDTDIDTDNSDFNEAEMGRIISPDFVSAQTKQVTIIIPITFKFDSVEFSVKGHVAAWQMLKQLEIMGSPDITLLGHTDPIGTDAYNQVLALARSETVKKFLRAQSYKGKILAEGAGETSPLPQKEIMGKHKDDPNDVLNTLLRRVELLQIPSK